jgi:hypothetical protein
LKQVKMIMKYYWSYIIIYFSMMKLNWILFECMLIDE